MPSQHAASLWRQGPQQAPPSTPLLRSEPQHPPQPSSPGAPRGWRATSDSSTQPGRETRAQMALALKGN
ncbi:hypothetical protein EGK_13159 [Macaca mulatta]|uniref:Uncharacterized protein n=1 Tax=Macaca mulatta TaxID=9544 RepID=F7EKF3_MACMU|nr:hypothetical protein EGK_13159 [Macaca mulatta]